MSNIVTTLIPASDLMNYAEAYLATMPNIEYPEPILKMAAEWCLMGVEPAIDLLIVARKNRQTETTQLDLEIMSYTLRELRIGVQETANTYFCGQLPKHVKAINVFDETLAIKHLKE